MILITGAAGKTGLALIRALKRKGAEIRAFIRRSEQSADVLSAGASQAFVGDLSKPESVERAMAGIDMVYHICPNVSPDELTIGRNIINAAKSRGTERFVYHSVLHPQTEKMPHHWLKMRVEEELLESGLTFTILQPAPYMQNILVGWKRIVLRGLYTVPYDEKTRVSMVDLDDAAEAAAKALTESGHESAVYELSGPDVLNQLEMAQVLSDRLGKQVTVQVVDRQNWEQEARDRGLGTYQRDALLKMFEYYERFGLVGNPRVLNWILGRPSNSFAEFVDRVAGENE